MKRIELEKFSLEDRITREGGEKLREMILKFGGPVTILFPKKPIASVSFFDEGIAKLVYEGWSEERILSEIQLQGIHPRDLMILKDLVRSRAREA